MQKYLLSFLFLFYAFSSSRATDVSSTSESTQPQSTQFSTYLIPEKAINARGYGQSHAIQQFPYCSTNSSISFSSYPPTVCPQGHLGLSANALNFMNTHFNKCVAFGLKEIGIRKTFKRVDISGQGGAFRKRSNSGRISTHTSGDAIDINHLKIEFTNGSTEIFPASAVNYAGQPFEGFLRCSENCNGRRWNMTNKAVFYEMFRRCLSQAIEAEKAKSPGVQCSGGTLGCNDDNSHDNHLHLSFPVCPKLRNFRNI